MGAEGQVIVDAQALDEGASDADTVAGQIEQQLGDLRGYLAPLVANWTGEASSDYQALQQRWNTSADDLNAVLREIAGALRTASQNYVSGESRNAAMWQG
ncbi:MAG TPA: WXG100 family type VII secretion target [Terriglobales bacterium]|nr:WXG100 family type VII secretion target [Terriglobales bacterium]